MATITAVESITLDGVMQGLGRPDEDTRDGFAHGGWGQGYSDDVLASFVGEGMQQEGACCSGTAPTPTCWGTGRRWVPATRSRSAC